MTRRREGKGEGDSIASLACPSLHCCHITNPSPSHSSRILMSVLAPLTTKARRSRRRGRASRNVRKGRSTRRKEDGDDANAMACSLARSLACVSVCLVDLGRWWARSLGRRPPGPDPRIRRPPPPPPPPPCSMLLYFRRRAGGSRGFRGFDNRSDCYFIHSSVCISFC